MKSSYGTAKPMSGNHIHILPYKDLKPTYDDSVFFAPGACVFGDVQLGKNVSFWCNSVARGDVNRITIGDDSNIQDLCVLHVTEEHPCTIGNQVTVGHHVMIHGCTIGNRCLIGMGSVILDAAEIGDECVIAAGTLITPGTKIPPGSLVMGAPGKVKRALTPEERKQLTYGSDCYKKYARNYLQTSGWTGGWSNNAV